MIIIIILLLIVIIISFLHSKSQPVVSSSSAAYKINDQDQQAAKTLLIVPLFPFPTTTQSQHTTDTTLQIHQISKMMMTNAECLQQQQNSSKLLYAYQNQYARFNCSLYHYLSVYTSPSLFFTVHPSILFVKRIHYLFWSSSSYMHSSSFLSKKILTDSTKKRHYHHHYYNIT